MVQAFESQVISLVCEGTFVKFPELRIVLIEGGFAWLPALMWRLDRSWRILHSEVPHLRRLPSEYIREHFWMTTQPMEEPPMERAVVLETVKQIICGDRARRHGDAHITMRKIAQY